MTDETYTDSDDELYESIKAQEKSDLNTATVRTVVPAAWTAVAVWGITKAGLDVSTDDLVTLAPVFAVVGGVVYRFARFVEAKLPTLGFILLGSKKRPSWYE